MITPFVQVTNPATLANHQQTMNTIPKFGSTVYLIPTQGAYQHPLEAVMLLDTETEYRVRVKTETRTRRFRKSTMLHVSPHDRQFPNCKLSFTQD